MKYLISNFYCVFDLQLNFAMSLKFMVLQLDPSSELTRTVEIPIMITKTMPPPTMIPAISPTSESAGEPEGGTDTAMVVVAVVLVAVELGPKV
jgi:hypothetical protein